MVLKVTGNICVALAALAYLIPLPLLVSYATQDKAEHEQEEYWLFLLLFLFLWSVLAVALCASTGNGGFDWLPAPRGLQYAMVLATALAAGMVSAMSGMLRGETADQMPWAMRVFTPGAWAMWLFPLVTIVYCLLTVNREPGAKAPPVALWLPMSAVGGLALLAVGAFLVEWVVAAQQRQVAETAHERDRVSESVRSDLEAVAKLDVERDFGELLGYTGRDNDAQVRELAVGKVRSVSDLEDRLATRLGNDWYLYALIYLEENEPPDRKPLAEPVRVAITRVADRVRGSIRRSNQNHASIWPESFGLEVRLVLSAADNYGDLGVDYGPAVRTVRSAFEEPLEPKLRFDHAADLDRWLAGHGRGTK